MRQKAERQLPRVVIGFVLSALHLTFDMFVNSLSLTDCVSVMSVFGGIISTTHELDVDSSSLTHSRIASVDSAQVVSSAQLKYSVGVVLSSSSRVSSVETGGEEQFSPSTSLRHLSQGAAAVEVLSGQPTSDERHSKGRLT